MFGTMKRGVNAYANVALDTSIDSASPHKLIVLLFDGALAALLGAKLNIAAGNIAAKGSAISKAISIIDNGLRASLDKDAGGEIAANLDALYDYMSRRLLQANLKNDVTILEEVQRLLGELRGAWLAIGDKVNQPAGGPNAAMQAAPTLVGA